jgi:hypothetical protein
MRVWFAVLLAFALLSGCSQTERPEAVSAGRCHGVDYNDVRGKEPKLARSPLQDYPAAKAVCAAYWIPQVDQYFVPQALEVDGRTAYVGGYHWVKSFGKRPCQIAVVNLRTGAVKAFVAKFEAPVYDSLPTYCRHGGGMELTKDGLWVSEHARLWLLDPKKLGHGDPVKRVWRLEAPVVGSTVVITNGRLGLSATSLHGRSRMTWFRLADVLESGTTHLRHPIGTGPVPPRMQGMTADRAGVWFSSSRTHCAALRPPGKRAVSFVPGAEDIELVGHNIWTVSESGSKLYLDSDEDVVPMLLKLDRRTVLKGPTAHCDW